MSDPNPDWNCNAWSEEDRNDYIARLVVGPIVGVVIAFIMLILTALPLCCGVMKAQGRIIAMIAIPLSLLAMFMPLFLSLGTCEPFVEDLCKGCKDQNGDPSCDNVNPLTNKTPRQELDESCTAIGIIVAYFFWGWAAVVLGVIAMGLSCCIFCGCCQMKEDTTYADGGQTSA